MSTIRKIDNTYKAPGSALPEAKGLILLDTQVEAMLDLIYGSTTRPQGIAPGHDHQEDGGESLKRPILSHSFGQHVKGDGTTVRGLPLGRPSTGSPSFAPVVIDGVSDPSNAPRLYHSLVMIPGGVKGVRVSLVVANTTAGASYTLAAVFRGLGEVNFKLGRATAEVRGDFTITRSGAGSNALYHFAIEIPDLSELGDQSQDQELEFSLWLTSDAVTTLYTDMLCHVEILPSVFTGARQPRADDRQQPKFAVREIQTGVGIFSPILGQKLKTIYNNLNRALWGSSPGLLPDGSPDVRRRYQETIDDCHRHQGIHTPDIDGTVYGDGAVLADHQSFGFVEIIPGEDPTAATCVRDETPTYGRHLHEVDDLSSGWTTFSFRRSIPSGLGALLFRFGVQPGDYTKTATLLAKVSIAPLDDPTADIVTRTSCKGFLSEIQASHPDYKYCELVPRNDLGFSPNGSLLDAGTKGWNLGSQIAQNQITQQGLNKRLYRISEPLVVKLTYPPLQPLDPRHETADYQITVKFKLRLTSGGAVYDTEAFLQWLTCYSMPGF